MGKTFITIWNIIFNVHHITQIIKFERNNMPGIRIYTLADAMPNEKLYSTIERRDTEFINLLQMLSKY